MPYQIDYTQFTQYDNLELIAKQVVTGFITGLHKSPLHGFSVEFAEHRQYNPNGFCERSLTSFFGPHPIIRMLLKISMDMAFFI